MEIFFNGILLTITVLLFLGDENKHLFIPQRAQWLKKGSTLFQLDEPMNLLRLPYSLRTDKGTAIRVWLKNSSIPESHNKSSVQPPKSSTMCPSSS